jgi:hypothetical protein
MKAVRALQLNLQKTDARLQHVEEAGKVFGDSQHKMDEKVDSIYKILTQWNNSEMGTVRTNLHLSPIHRLHNTYS